MDNVDRKDFTPAMYQFYKVYEISRTMALYETRLLNLQDGNVNLRWPMLYLKFKNEAMAILFDFHWEVHRIRHDDAEFEENDPRISDPKHWEKRIEGEKELIVCIYGSRARLLRSQLENERKISFKNPEWDGYIRYIDVLIETMRCVSQGVKQYKKVLLCLEK